ncbi:MAG: PfkB family carbohydrate kinase, partial [Chloroflexota bacterium]|nr:PfkB family carbohydrate kinase [Chloroflexota bacterium]
LAARIGPDYPLSHISLVRDAGVRLALVEVAHASIHDWALYESDRVRRFINWVGSGSHLEQSIRADELPGEVLSARACHVAPMPLTVQAGLVQALASRGVRIVALDPHEEYIPGHEAELVELLRSVTLFLPSRLETQLLYGRDDPEDAAAAFASAGPKAVAIKLGAEGSIVSAPGAAPRHVPAVPVRAVDPTGCGDSFCGGFVAAFRRGADAITAACHGTVSASFTVETRGASAVLPLDAAAARDRLERLLALVAPLPSSPTPLNPPATGGHTYAPG